MKITLRNYNSSTGALLSNASAINFGKVAAGTHSRVQVFDISFDEATTVSGLSLGIISDGNIVVNPDPSTRDYYNTTSNGHFGIESTTSFDSSKAATPLTRHFPGLNGIASSSDDNNVLVPMRSATISNYIYLDVEVGSTDSTTAGNGSYKIFFDYA